MGKCPKVGAKLLLIYQLDNFLANYFKLFVKTSRFQCKNK